MHIKLWEAIPERWFVCGTIEHHKGGEYYFAVLRLPSYQFMNSLVYDAPRWHQLALMFHGLYGFKFEWLLCTAPGKRGDRNEG